MIPGTKSKKRKATARDDEVAKEKKVKQMAENVPPKKRKTTDGPDLASAKKIKAPKAAPKEGNHSISINKRNRTESSNHQGGTKKPNSEAEITEDRHEKVFTTGDSEDEGIDDQAHVLLKGFESDDESSTVSEDQGYKFGDAIPEIEKKIQKKIKAAQKASTSDEPGVVYIGRIPHGFYEQEMKQYFSQFGNITNLRLSRNRRTGKSKHFAFVEFESGEVAEIVSKTMDNYLLFGHILKCKLVAPEQVHENLWIGANRRFKSVPWNKIQGRKLSQPMTAAGWEKRTEREEKRRAEKKEAMKLIGYEFETPNLKSAREVLKIQQAQKSIGHGSDQGDQITVGPVEKVHNMELQEQDDNMAVAKSTNGAAPEPSKKEKIKEATPSSELVGVVETEKPTCGEDAKGGRSEKVVKAKKNKKHRAV